MRLGRIDIASLAVEGLTGGISGGIQQLAWRQQQQIGMLATGLALLAGVGLKVLGGGMLTNQIGDALYLSGASIAGWKISERVFPAGAAAFVAGRKQAFAGTPYSGMPIGPSLGAVGAPSMPVAPWIGGMAATSIPRAPTPGGAQIALPSRPASYARPPSVSISGVNPNTGEEILFSRV